MAEAVSFEEEPELGDDFAQLQRSTICGRRSAAQEANKTQWYYYRKETGFQPALVRHDTGMVNSKLGPRVGNDMDVRTIYLLAAVIVAAVLAPAISAQTPQGDREILERIAQHLDRIEKAEEVKPPEWLGVPRGEWILRGLTLLVVGIGVYAALRRIKETERQATAATRSAEAATKQAGIAQKGHVTDGFIRAIGLLGKIEPEELPFRLGGIYALEKIAKDEPARYHWTVMEVLCAFVRERTHSRRIPEMKQPVKTAEIKVKTAQQRVTESESRIIPPATDVQAVLTVLRRRNHEAEEESQKLDLRGAHLERAFLAGAHLEGAHLEGANFLYGDLEGAHLEGAHLEEAFLGGANLKKAFLGGAHLNEAQIGQAHLEGADLKDADLEGTDLNLARLEGADLKSALLGRAKLNSAHLQRANLMFADLKDTLGLMDFREAKRQGISHVHPVTSIQDANISGVKNPPEGFVRWALQQGAVEMSEEEWREMLRRKKKEEK